MKDKNDVEPAWGDLVDDLPADHDALDFIPYVRTLAEIIKSPSAKTPLTIGILGTWGSGKTSLLRMIRAELPRGYSRVWFDAWKYDKEESLWRAFLLRILNSIRDTVSSERSADAADLELLDDLESALYRAVDRDTKDSVHIDWNALVPGLAKGAIQVGLSFVPGASSVSKFFNTMREKGSETTIDGIVGAISRERTQTHVDQIKFLEQFQERFSQLVAKYVIGRGEGRGRMVVFIDDLDRCLPLRAIELLESMKLFSDQIASDGEAGNERWPSNAAACAGTLRQPA